MGKSKVATASTAAEVAKTTGKALGLVEGAGRFFEQILGPGLNHLGGSFSDWAATFRYENALKLGDKVDAIHKARGINGPTRPINPRLAIPLIQSASIEGDSQLQDLWAGLIANATDPTKLVEARRDFIVLLAALEPLDARCLLAIRDAEVAMAGVQPGEADRAPLEGQRYKRNAGWLAMTLGVPKAAAQLSVEGLARNGLIVDSVDDPEDMNPRTAMLVPVTHKEADLWLSFTAAALLDLCQAVG